MDNLDKLLLSWVCRLVWISCLTEGDFVAVTCEVQAPHHLPTNTFVADGGFPILDRGWRLGPRRNFCPNFCRAS